MTVCNGKNILLLTRVVLQAVWHQQFFFSTTAWRPHILQLCNDAQTYTVIKILST